MGLLWFAYVKVFIPRKELLYLCVILPLYNNYIELYTLLYVIIPRTYT